jgi:hypothetical protein
MRRSGVVWCSGMVMLVSAMITHTVGAQSVVRVLDRDSLPIPFALVQVDGGEARAADSSGRVRLGAAIGALPRLSVRRMGYVPFNGPTPRTPGGEHVVVLEPLARDLAAVRTVAPRSTPLSRTGFYDRMERVRKGAFVGWFVTSEELEQRKVLQISRALQGVGSVRVVRNRDGRPIVTGRGNCPMTVLIDGIRQNSLLKGSSLAAPTSLNPRGTQDNVGGDLSIDELVEGGSVMAVEIYPSTANAPSELIPLSGGGSCGLIALWTGPRH